MHRAVVLLVLLAACDAPPVQWADPIAVGGDDADRITLDASGATRVVANNAEPAALPTDPNLCGSSVRTVHGTASLHAAWWSVRHDSSAILYSAASRDSGRSWGPPVRVDTLDKSPHGCRRPAPALATVGDDLQLAYSMIAPEGTGVFYAHFMGSMLHEPVAVIYGERLVATAIAAEGERIAVAYEEPNGSRAQVDVALSSTQGHIFEMHTTASRGVDIAAAPAVALAGPWLAVAWTTRRSSDSAAARVVRVGRVQ